MQPEISSRPSLGARALPLFADRARVHAIVFGALVLLTCYCSLRDFYSFQFGYKPDAVEYTLLAQSLLKGPFFGLVHTPTLAEETHYPFGYPLLLTPFVLLAPRDFTLTQWLSFGATLVSGAILFWGWRTLVPNYSDGWRYAVTAMFMLAPVTIVQSRVTLADAVFMVFVLLSLVFAARLLRTPRHIPLLLGFSIAAVFLVSVRSIGLVILGSILLYLAVVLRRRVIRPLLILAGMFVALNGAVLVFTPVQIQNLMPASYVRWFVAFLPFTPEEVVQDDPDRPAVPALLPAAEGDDEASSESSQGDLVLDLQVLAQHVHQDLRRLITLTGGGSLEAALAERVSSPWLLSVPGFFLLGLLVLGNVRWARDSVHADRHISLFQFASFGYLAVLLFWRGGEERLLYPVQPQIYLTFLLAVALLLGGLVNAVSRVLNVADHARNRTIVRAALGALVVMWLGVAVYRDLNLQSSYAVWGDLRQRTDPIEALTPPDAVLVSDWPEYDFLITGRHTIEFPRGSGGLALMRAVIREHGIDYIVMSYNPEVLKPGISPLVQRVRARAGVLAEMVTNGELEPVYKSSFPLRILRVVQ